MTILFGILFFVSIVISLVYVPAFIINMVRGTFKMPQLILGSIGIGYIITFYLLGLSKLLQQ